VLGTVGGVLYRPTAAADSHQGALRRKQVVDKHEYCN